MPHATRYFVSLIVLPLASFGACPLTVHADATLESAAAASAGNVASGAGFTLGFTIGQSLVGVATPADGTLAETAGFWRWGLPTVLDAGPVAVPATPRLALAPNPARAGVTIRLALSTTRAGMTRVAILDVSGRLVRELVSSRLDAGLHHLEWNGRDRHGAPVAPGLYFCRATMEGHALNRRFAVIR